MTTTNYIGLSTTQPSLTGANINEALWPNYTRLAIDLSTWTNVGTIYTNTSVVGFPQANVTVNTFVSVPYFVIYDSSNVFVCAGSVNTTAFLGQNALLNFNPGCFIFDTSKVTFIPDTSNIAFPSVTYPAFVPTYEPAALSTPIQYMQNMRS